VDFPTALARSNLPGAELATADGVVSVH
jgi:hypothetical protein